MRLSRTPKTVLKIEAVDCVDAILMHPLLDNIHIGLNDLHLSYGLTFLFEPLVTCVGLRLGFFV